MRDAPAQAAGVRAQWQRGPRWAAHRQHCTGRANARKRNTTQFARFSPPGSAQKHHYIDVEALP